jgi:tRNA modification GTPase
LSVRAVELTPPGTGAVSVLEVSGAGALNAVSALVGETDLRPGDVRLARLGSEGEALDEALVVVRAPDHLELCLHGNPLVVRAVREALGGGGGGREAGVASGGERAWAEELLADAPCEAAARIVLDQLGGALARELDRLSTQADPARLAGARELAARSRAARRALVPARVVLAGPVNAGKSTLFNALVGSARTIVTPEEGTTRDAVRQRTCLGEWPVELIDTAGERAERDASRAAGAVERAGVALGRALRPRADLVIWLAPPDSRPPVASDGERRVVVASRVDELAPEVSPGEGISALHRPREACDLLGALFRSALGLGEQAWQAGRGVLLDPAALAELERAVEGEPADLDRVLAALE